MTTSNDWDDVLQDIIDMADAKANHEPQDYDGRLGAFVWHLEADDIDTLHERVHGPVGEWIANRAQQDESNISDEMRMASHCLANAFSDGLERQIEETNEISSEMIYNLLRAAIQIGYVLKADEDSGQLSI